MAFGKRNSAEWQATLADIGRIDDAIEKAGDGRVELALAQVRQQKLLADMLAPVQQDLWDDLVEANKVGGIELVGLNFKFSGLEMTDLLDLLYVVVELNAFGATPENEEFEEALLGFLATKSGPVMDVLLANYFNAHPNSVEPKLMRLVTDETLIRSRLSEVLKMEYDKKTQSLVAEATLQLLKLDKIHTKEQRQKITCLHHTEIKPLLKRLMQDETILDKRFIHLVRMVNHAPTMFELMRKIIGWLENPEFQARYVSGFDSVGSTVVRKLENNALIFTINSISKHLVDERLLALYRIKSLTRISDDALVDLLMERRDAVGKRGFVHEQRDRLRKSIIRNREFRPRLMKLGIIGMFPEPTFALDC